LSARQILFKSDHPRGVITYINFRNSGYKVDGFFLYDVTRLRWLKYTKYTHTKFRRDISVDGWHITTSGCWKQTATILEFYYLFQ